MKDIAIYGFGGFGREVACLLAQINEVKPTWNQIGFFDDNVPPGTENRYGKVLGNIATLNSFTEPISIVLAIANPDNQKKITCAIKNSLVDFPNIIAPDVLILDKNSLKIGHGNIVFFSCRISCDVSIGNFNIFNSLVSLGHDVSVGDYNIFMPETRISGSTKIGNSNFTGVRSLIIQNLKIGNNTRIAAGSVVIRNTKDGFLYLGNPAKKVVL